MKKIESLTWEQEQQLSSYRDRWLAIGLSTEPTDDDAAREAVRKMYACGKLDAPKLIIIVDSPLQCVMAGAMMQSGAQVGAQVRDQVWDQVGAQVWAQVWDQVWDQVGDQVGAQVWACTFGQQDAHWLAFYSYMEMIGATGVDALQGLIDCAQHVNWMLPYETTCIVSRKPKTCALAADGLLHCETGPAVEYNDGFAVYSWRGVRIPEEWVSDRPPEAAKLLHWDNIEQRRVGCEMLGWHNVIEELRPTVVDENPDPQVGTLLGVNLPDSGYEQFLKIRCSTGRDFALPVPPDVKTALEANAHTWGLSASEYNPIIQT